MELTATEPTAPTETARTEPTATGPTARPDPGFPALAELIGEGEVERFLQTDFGRAPWRGRIVPAMARAYFGWDVLNDALAQHRLAPPRLKLERAGADVSREAMTSRRSRRGALLQDVEPAALTRALRDGATLILDAANEISPPLQALCAGLAAEFLCACQANLYACWGTTQGFDVHWDDHDVFILQVEGRKTWRLYGSTRKAPTRGDPQAEHPKPETPVAELVLEPGDILYLPRGEWHAAVGRGEPTLHLTIGLTRRMGVDFLKWLADYNLSKTAVRADLPLERDDDALGARIAELLAQLAAADTAELARLYRRHVQSTQAHRPKFSLPFLGRPDEDLPDAARLRLTDGAVALRAADDPALVVLSWRGTEFTLAGELTPCLRRLAAGETVTAGELRACVSERERPLASDLMAELLARGVLVAELQA